jgi:hypothetical protein
VDPGQGRILYYSLGGEYLESVGGIPPRDRYYLEPDGSRLLALDYTVGFRVRGHYSIPGNDLVEFIDLPSGVVGDLPSTPTVAPRGYRGHVAPILANSIRVARSVTDGSLWVGWRFDERLDRYRGGITQRFDRKLGFEPSAWRERVMQGRGTFRAQAVTFDLDVGTDGLVIVLGAAEKEAASPPETGWRGRITPLSGAAQAIDVLTGEGALVCRVPIPIRATSIRVVGPGEVVLTDAAWTGAVHRLQYRCPQR